MKPCRDCSQNMRIAPTVDRISVVLVGNFNPAIFSPAWFALNGLVSKQDADQARVALIHPEVSQFDVGQFSIQVDSQRFSASCLTSYHEMARDLVVGTFGTCLMHTPITALGINRETHFDTGDFFVRDAVGERLAPKMPWGDWGPEICGPHEASSDHGGLMRLTMRQGRPGHRYKGYIQADVQPSTLPDLVQTGIYIMVNNHYQLSADSKVAPIRDLLDAIETEWTPALDKSELIIDQIQLLAETCKAEAARKPR
jgi:hypothetical protein